LARLQVGRRLIEQQALMHCLLDSIPDPIYVKDSRGLYLGCNQAYARFVGMDASEILEQSASDVLSEERAQQSHMEDLRVLANGETVDSEGWVTAADGQEVYHNTVKMPYLESSAGSTGMIGISRDLTRRMEMEQEMRRLAVAVEQSTESVMITDVEGSILYVNKAFENLCGYNADEVIGQHPDLLKSDTHDASYFNDLWSTISSGQTWSGQMTNRKKDGNLYTEEAVIYPIWNDKSEVVNYVSISRDITHEMAIEKHLRQQQKMNAIGELAGGVSHDFNNILTAILGYVALCMHSVDEESKVYGYLKEIVKAGDRATKLVRQILTFSRQEEQEFKETELQPIIEDTLSMVQTTMKKNIELLTNIAPDCGTVQGDATQLQQIMINLCTNACHALGQEDNGGTLKVSLKQVELLSSAVDHRALDLEAGHYACITVADTGCGMPPEVLERVFEPYFTTKKKGEGTGFGLSIVHGIVQKHQGAINVESRQGSGTTFSVYLPIMMGDAEQQREIVERSTPAGHGRILFVDDDDTILSMGRELMESFGYTVVTANSGASALEIFKLHPEGFDALVTDYSMPEMNGHSLIKRALEIRENVPAILCSGYMEKVEGEDLRQLGLAAYMGKPVDWRELCRTIQQEVQKKE
jgi:PAS domain S-box-containing protein